MFNIKYMFSSYITLLFPFIGVLRVNCEEIVESNTDSQEALIGETANFLCKTPELFYTCSFELPNEEEFEVTENLNNSVVSYYGSGFHNGECGLTIKSVQKEHQGEIFCSFIKYVKSGVSEFGHTMQLDVYNPTKVTPAIQTVFPGDSATFSCKVSEPIESCMFWISDQHEFLNVTENFNDSFFYYHGNGLKNGECGLFLKNVEKQHGGLVKCILHSNEESYLGKMTLEVENIVEVIPANQTTFFGESANFLCVVPYPITSCRFMIYYHHDHSASEVYNVTEDFDERSVSYYGKGFKNGQCGIKIDSIEASIEAVCILPSKSGNRRETGTLHLYPLGRAEVALANQTVLPGQIVSFICKSREPLESCSFDIPNEPRYELYRRGDGSYYEKKLRKGECEYIITDVEEKHAGILSCELHSTFVTYKGEMFLEIIRVPNQPQFIPEILLNYNEGEHLKVKCVIAKGRPAAEILWFLDDELLTEGLSNINIEEEIGENLKTVHQNITRKLSFKDNDKLLKCVASNSAYKLTASAKLNIFFAPKVINGLDQVFKVKIASNVRIKITVYANPEPTYKWLINGKEIVDAPDQNGRIYTKYLTPLGNYSYNIILLIPLITHEDIANKYILHVHNAAGNNKCNVIIMEDRPHYDANDNSGLSSPESSQEQSCSLPKLPDHGSYKLLGSSQKPIPNKKVDPETILKYDCNDSNYAIDSSQFVECQQNGTWSHEPHCKKMCTFTKPTTLDPTCSLNGNDIPCMEIMKHGSKITFKCKAQHFSSFLRPHRCVDGYWDNPTQQCEPVCGREPGVGVGFILGGKKTEKGTFPWHVAIYSNIEDGSIRYICGGTILKNNIILSAAHCFYNDHKKRLYDTSKYFVTAGNTWREFNHLKDQQKSYFEKSRVKKIIVPDQYGGNDQSHQSDIAIIELLQPFNFSQFVLAACIDLTDTEFDRQQLTNGNIGKTAGWGVTAEGGVSSDYLQFVELPIVSYKECLDNLPSTFHKYLTNDKFCAGYLNGTGVCSGDSGGGIFFSSQDRGQTKWYLRGIVSVGVPSNIEGVNTCKNDTYSGFTRMFTHGYWISEILDKYS